MHLVLQKGHFRKQNFGQSGGSKKWNLPCTWIKELLTWQVKSSPGLTISFWDIQRECPIKHFCIYPLATQKMALHPCVGFKLKFGQKKTNWGLLQNDFFILFGVNTFPMLPFLALVTSTSAIFVPRPQSVNFTIEWMRRANFNWKKIKNMNPCQTNCILCSNASKIIWSPMQSFGTASMMSFTFFHGDGISQAYNPYLQNTNVDLCQLKWGVVSRLLFQPMFARCL